MRRVVLRRFGRLDAGEIGNLARWRNLCLKLFGRGGLCPGLLLGWSLCRCLPLLRGGGCGCHIS